MKLILKKDLPLAKAGTEWLDLIYECQNRYRLMNWEQLLAIFPSDKSEWFEEVKEKKTIYDIVSWEYYWYLWEDGEISRIESIWSSYIDPLNDFLTEREAKRNKLLRELATRTDKWLPEMYEVYIDLNWKSCIWLPSSEERLNYNLGFIFLDKEEYNKYMTEDAKDLLFNI